MVCGSSTCVSEKMLMSALVFIFLLCSTSRFFLHLFPIFSVFWGDVGMVRDYVLCVFCCCWFGLNIVDTKSFCVLVQLVFCCWLFYFY